MKYIDIHGHVNFPVYDPDRAEVIKRCDENDIGLINVGTDFETSYSAVELAKKYSNMWAIIGLHPVHAGESHNDPTETGLNENKQIGPKSFQVFDSDKFLPLAKDSKVVAIGECGLDYFHSRPEDIDKQKKELEKQIDFANRVNKPLMLHVRNAKTGPSAYMEVVGMLRARANVKANFHFFAGDIEDLKNILDIGGTVSFTGVITFARNYDELIKYVPIDRIMSETDCPFVAPAPYRGKRNEPSYVVEVVKTIAKIRGEDEDVVAKQLVQNAKDFFSI